MLSPYLSSLIQRAAQNPKTIVLPEGEDERVLEAAYLAVQNKVAKPVVLGNIDEIKAFFDEKKWSLDGIQIIETEKSKYLEEIILTREGIICWIIKQEMQKS